LKESTAILRFTGDWGLTGALETTQSVTSLNPSQTSTPKTEPRYRQKLSCSDVTFIKDLNGSEAVRIAVECRVDTTIWVLKAALASVLRIHRTNPEDLLSAVAVVPESVLSAVELKRNRKRVEL